MATWRNHITTDSNTENTSVIIASRQDGPRRDAGPTLKRHWAVFRVCCYIVFLLVIVLACPVFCWDNSAITATKRHPIFRDNHIASDSPAHDEGEAQPEKCLVYSIVRICL